MFKRSLPRLTLLAVTAALLFACGGPQSSGGPGERWNSATDAIPESAAWMVWYDFDRTDEEVQAYLSDALGGPQAMLLSGLFDLFGLDPTDPESVQQFGVDFQGELAVFSTGLLPAAVLRVRDEAAFRDRLEGIVQRNPDYVRSEFELGGIPFVRFEDSTTETAFDMAVDGPWAILRMPPSETLTGVDDEALLSILRGRGVTPFLQGHTGRELLERLPDGARPDGLAYLPTGTIAAMVQNVLAQDGGLGALLRGVGVSLLRPEYETEELRERCLNAQERIITSVPFFAALSWESPTDPHVSQGEFLIRLSPAALERFGAGFAGVPPLDGFDGDAALFGAVALDLGALLAGVRGDPSLRACPDLASIPGWITFYRDTRTAPLRQLRSAFDGRAGFALFDFQMAGFLPLVSAAVMTSSTDALTLLTRIQRMLEQSGAAGQVDETAPNMTFRYRLLAYRILLTLRDPLVAAATGDVDRGQLTLLTNPESTADFLRIDATPHRLAEMLRPAVDLLAENETATTGQLEPIYQLLDRWAPLRSHTLRAQRSDRMLILHTRIERLPENP